MKLQGSHTVPAPRQQVWEALNDPAMLQRCTPGCRRMVVNAAGGYDTELELNLGAIKGRFGGTIEIRDRVPGSRYSLAVSARGPAGFLNAAGDVELKEMDGATRIEFSGQAQTGGTIAGIGQRVMDSAARRLVAQFFECFVKALTEPRP